MRTIDKIILSSKDVTNLLHWRDEHQELVRKTPAPFKAIELVFPEVKMVIKGFRNGDQLKLQVNRKGMSLGNVEYQILPSGLCIGKTNKSKMQADEAQDCLTVYCSLMALIAYTQREINSAPVNTDVTSTVSKKKLSKRKGGISVTYLLSKASEMCRERAVSERKKPSHAYSVRGHFRHYKSGKVIWIEQHVRCDGKKKSKAYKLGKTIEPTT